MSVKSIQEKAREFSLGYLSKAEQDAAFQAYVEGYKTCKKDKVQRDDWDLSFVEVSFRPIIYDWICYRKEKKMPLVDRSIKMAYKKLYEMSDGSSITAMKIVEQSIGNGWQGLFPLKDNNVNGKYNQMLQVGQIVNDSQSEEILFKANF